MPIRLHAVLLPLLLATSVALAGEPDRTAHRLIDGLGLSVRQALEDRKSGKTPDDAERAVAEQIGVLVRDPARQPSLIEADEQGRTPLMLAASGSYLQVVNALLADAGVRATIDRPDANGETAWMVANFAPALTLVACQPATLTLERYPLLPPYLLRMTALLHARKSVAVSIVQTLEAAGAQPTPEAARRAWLARCPNARPELQSAIAAQSLLPALANESLAQLMSFNKAYREGRLDIPQRPPEDMRFISDREVSGAPAPAVLDSRQLKCARRAPPAVRGSLGWSGSVLLKVRAATRAGIVEAVDFTLLSPGTPDPRVVNFFRGATIQALAAYQCEGDHVFEQEFQFNVD